ncbi:retention module-containing protein, partial [Thioalkalivibrio sp. ARh4]
MAEVIATVESVDGTVIARDADGNTRVLREGDEIFLGEEVIAEDGAFIQLAFADGSSFELAGADEVTVTEELAASYEADPQDAAVGTLTAEEIIAALERGDPIDDMLEPPAAGLAGAGGDNEGASFVRIARIDEPVPGIQYGFPFNEFPDPTILPAPVPDGL